MAAMEEKPGSVEVVKEEEKKSVVVQRIPVKLESVVFDAFWRFSFKESTDICQICRKNIMAVSPDDMANGFVSSGISIGVCGHAFHRSCITQYTKKHVSCPIDLTPWKTDENINAYGEVLEKREVVVVPKAVPAIPKSDLS